MTQRDRVRLKADTEDMDAFRGANSVMLMYWLAEEMGDPGDCAADCNCVGCEADARRREAEERDERPFACECC